LDREIGIVIKSLEHRASRGTGQIGSRAFAAEIRKQILGF